ncbi:MAG: Hpt domain-containing protein [Bacteroidales bacterium]|nr:Hpt domain-containing protein [Bacteroidales bacterium]
MSYKYINLQYIESVAGGDKETIKELYVLFKDQVKEIAGEMKRLHDSKDFYNLGLLAHKAKSSVAIMGMEELAALLKRFELQAKNSEEPEKYSFYIDQYRHDTAGAVEELEDYLGLKRD